MLEVYYNGFTNKLFFEGAPRDKYLEKYQYQYDKVLACGPKTFQSKMCEEDIPQSPAKKVNHKKAQ